MDKQTRLSVLKSRFSALRFGASVAVASLAAMKVQQHSDDRDAQRRISQTLKTVLPAMDDSVADNDKIEATVSKLQFDSDTDAQGWIGSATLTRAEREQLKREVQPFRKFRSDIAAIPLRLMA